MAPAFIYFDLGKVLLAFDHGRAARQMAEVAGVAEARVWEVVFESDLEHRIESGQIDGREFYEQFCSETGTRPDYDALEWAGSAIFDVNARMLPIVVHLWMAGYRLGILSNTCQSHWEYCISGRFATIPTLFERAVLSYEVGVMKPAPKIYQVAAAEAGVAPEEIFFMDDRAENVEGALAAGFDAVLFTTAEQLAKDLRTRGVQFNY